MGLAAGLVVGSGCWVVSLGLCRWVWLLGVVLALPDLQPGVLLEPGRELQPLEPTRVEVAQVLWLEPERWGRVGLRVYILWEGHASGGCGQFLYGHFLILERSFSPRGPPLSSARRAHPGLEPEGLSQLLEGCSLVVQSSVVV